MITCGGKHFRWSRHSTRGSPGVSLVPWLGNNPAPSQHPAINPQLRAALGHKALPDPAPEHAVVSNGSRSCIGDLNATAQGNLCWAGWSSDGTRSSASAAARRVQTGLPQPPELLLRSQHLQFPISALANPSVALRWEAANPLSIATLLPINHPNGELAGMFKAPKGTGRGHFQSLKPKVFNN